VENVTFVHCPPERRILVNVPVRVRRARAACPCSQCGKSASMLTMHLHAMLTTPLVLPRAYACKGAPACLDIPRSPAAHTALCGRRMHSRCSTCCCDN